MFISLTVLQLTSCARKVTVYQLCVFSVIYVAMFMCIDLLIKSLCMCLICELSIVFILLLLIFAIILSKTFNIHKICDLAECSNIVRYQKIERSNKITQTQIFYR